MMGTLVLYAREAFWLYWQNGAEFVVEHADLVGRRIGSPLVVKLLLGRMVFAGILAMTVAWIEEISRPTPIGSTVVIGMLAYRIYRALYQ